MWKTIGSKIIFKHPRLTLAEDIVELPDGAHVPYLKYVSRHQSVTIICVRDGKVLLQREYSYPPNEVMYQFPGGKVEESESVEVAAQRELVEEAGLKADKLIGLGQFYVDNRRSDAKMHVFLANQPLDIEKKGGDREEDISSHWVSVVQLEDLIRKGEIKNAPLLAAWSLYRATN